ncbi:MAG: hypothetical protein DDT21_01887 [Syntrophomonadaceae bacterium]|nr:hypothetical protein [Bacillota bacterium]
MSHDFKQQLAWSEAQGHEPFWDAVYRKAFPDIVNHLLCSGDTVGQRNGVDRIVYLRNDKILRIDEKKRVKDYPDILLEYVSVDTTGAPGWIEKDLTIDYLAYAFMPSKTCYLFDWLMLKRAWRKYGEEWKAKYKPPVVAKNITYNTVSVAVPIVILRQAISTAAVIDVSKELKGWKP